MKLTDVTKQFTSEDSCHEYIEEMHRPNGEIACNRTDLRHTSALARQDAARDRLDGGETEPLIKLHRGAIVGRNRQCKLAEFLRTKRVGAGLHQYAAQSVTLKTGLHAKLRGVSHSGRDFAGQHRSHQI